ncbi:hypothetical protein [Ornithinimicrobium kibberense]|uniref:hypothetical protein n=1 Tax=Ornithinimicrobium kibberense TaxID=282060 RepID=UPI0036161128
MPAPRLWDGQGHPHDGGCGHVHRRAGGSGGGHAPHHTRGRCAGPPRARGGLSPPGP